MFVYFIHYVNDFTLHYTVLFLILPQLLHLRHFLIYLSTKETREKKTIRLLFSIYMYIIKMYVSDIDIVSPVNFLSHNLKTMTLRRTLVALPGKNK